MEMCGSDSAVDELGSFRVLLQGVNLSICIKLSLWTCWLRTWITHICPRKDPLDVESLWHSAV